MPNGQAASQINEEEPGCLSRVLNCPALGRRCRRSSVYLNGVFMVRRKSLNGGKSSPLSVLKKEQMNTELKSKKSESRSLPSSIRTSNPLPSAQIQESWSSAISSRAQAPAGWQNEYRLCWNLPMPKSPNPKQPK